jgi:hypothetical protein
MKLSITQAALGVIIILAACYVTGWMIHKAPSQLTQPLLDGVAGKTTYIDVVPKDEAPFNIARYGSYLLPALGIFLVITGTVMAARGGKTIKSLAISTIVAGGIVAILAFIITTWGYPTTFVSPHPDENNRMMMMFSNPGRSLILVQSVSAFLLLSGLAAVGVGIAQLVKSRKIVSI